MAVAVRQDKIYVIGGADEYNDSKNTMFVYDDSTLLWSTGAPMPTARRATRAAIVNDIIYVIGGAGALGAGTAFEAYGQFPPPVFLPFLVK